MRLQFCWYVAWIVSTRVITPARTLLLDAGSSQELQTFAADHPSSHSGSRNRATGRADLAEQQAGALELPDVQIGLGHGCRRTTDFIEQVCNNPLGNAGATGRPAITADLLVCDLPEIEPLLQPGSDVRSPGKAPSATYAVSGTVVIHGSDPDSSHAERELPGLGAASTSPAGPEDAGKQTGQRPETSYPGPDDEGFWRQRDGQHEWHPISDANPGRTGRDHTSDVGNDRSTPQTESRTRDSRDASHLSDYDAWSAEQEQGAFLSFNEWKERHAHESSDYIKKPRASHSGYEKQDATPPLRSISPISTGSAQDDVSAAEVKQDQSSSDRHDKLTTHTPSPNDRSAEQGHPQQTARNDEQTSATQADFIDAQHDPKRSVDDSESSMRRTGDSAQIGLSVAAGDTSAQLSKLKHRWNFASLDCAAVVHRTNPEAKFAGSILSEKKDRYMLSPCPHRGGKPRGGSQFVIVELCEEIKIDTIVLANYEFFSNMFKKFTVTAAKRLTGRESDWTRLGVFRARNVRGQQVFRIPSALRSEGFFRYVRIDFLEHFGSEFYCPVSLLRVYGITAMEDYKQQFEEQDAELDALSEIADPVQTFSGDVQQPSFDLVELVDAPQEASTLDTTNLTARDEDIWRKHEQAFQRKLQNQSLTYDAVEADSQDTGVPQRDNSPSSTLGQFDGAIQSSVLQKPPTCQDEAAEGIDTAQCRAQDGHLAPSAKHDVCVRPPHQLRPFYSLVTASSHQRQAKEHRLEQDSRSAELTSPPQNAAPFRSRTYTDAAESEMDPERARRASMQRIGGVPPAPQGNPGSESVYRAIHRRLSALESNATLSHSYIEHSGQMLREVFARMEKRQENRLSDMLRALNTSNWQQIESLKRRQHVDLQRAIFEFDVHRQQADTERRALLREVQILAEEVLLEKRLSIAQLVMLLVVFVFVGLTRGSRTVPLLHSSFAKFGASSKRRDAKTDGKFNVPASPRREVARSEQGAAARQAQNSPVREEALVQGRGGFRHEFSTVQNRGVQRKEQNAESATLAGKRRASSMTHGVLDRVAKLKTSLHRHARATANGSAPSRAIRIGASPEILIGLLSYTKTKGRLIMLLEALDALDRAAVRRRTPKAALKRPAAGHPNVDGKNLLAVPAVHPEQAIEAAKPLPALPRRTQRPMRMYKQEHYHAIDCRSGSPGRDRKSGPLGSEDLAGMSSDWTERSENGEASEYAAYHSEEDERAMPIHETALFSVDPAMNMDISLNRSKTTGRSGSPSTDPCHPSVRLTAAPTTSADAAPLAGPRDGPASRTQIESHRATSFPVLPSSARADGRLSSSDSESEGGAWHKVLPRRIGNGSNLRRARQTTNDLRSNKADKVSRASGVAEAVDRRGSPRPSSSHGSNTKSQRPGLAKLFRTETREHSSPNSPQNRRAGTPDTIRDANSP